MLASAVIDIDRGAFDDQVITWLAGQDVSVIATVASLLRRCWQAGSEIGRAEVVDEAPAVAAAQAEAADLARRLKQAIAERDAAREELEAVEPPC